MTERHRIYLKRAAGKPWPWTEDKILQTYKFTNVYRELDRTTQWFRFNFRCAYADKPEVFFGTVAFRWFNRSETGERLIGAHGERNLLVNWNHKQADRRLRPHPPWTTGAYIISTAAKGVDKLEGILRYIAPVWQNRAQWIRSFREQQTIEETVHRLTKIDGLGGFMAYEVATDLTHTYLLRNAPDLDMWAHPGPGAKRGLARLHGREVKKTGMKLEEAVADMRWLLAWVRERWYWPEEPLHLREIEHSLCEFDKYERVRLGEGRPRSVYRHD